MLLVNLQHACFIVTVFFALIRIVGIMKKIKMRVNKHDDAICKTCLSKKNESLEMYDLNFAGTIITICDQCNNVLFSKSLKASCRLDNKLKSSSDINIINRRRAKNDKIQ